MPHQAKQRRIKQSSGLEHPVVLDKPRAQRPQVVPAPSIDLRLSKPPDQLKAVSLLLLKLEVIRHAKILPSRPRVCFG